MIRVTATLAENDYETDTYPRGVEMGVDNRDRLYVYAGVREEGGVIRRTGTLAIYPEGHWLRAWVGGEEEDDAEYSADNAEGFVATR